MLTALNRTANGLHPLFIHLLPPSLIFNLDRPSDILFCIAVIIQAGTSSIVVFYVYA